MKELAALAYRDTTAENRDFWKNEMGNALREIQAAYDEKLEAMRAELEAYYNMKVQDQEKSNARAKIELDIYVLTFLSACLCTLVSRSTTLTSVPLLSVSFLNVT